MSQLSKIRENRLAFMFSEMIVISEHSDRTIYLTIGSSFGFFCLRPIDWQQLTKRLVGIISTI